MITINSINARIWSKLGPRGTYGTTIFELAPDVDNLMVLTADLCTSSGLDRFRTSFPDKYINIGIAEQNMIGIAAGLANEGYVVFCSTFAPFASMRACEQVRNHMGYMGLNIKLVGLASGVSTGILGNSHYGLEDIAVMRSIPNMTILSPADSTETAKATVAATYFEGPVYIRLTGIMNNPIVYKEDYDFEIGKAIMLREGTDITIVATGTMVYKSLEAAKLLEKEGISVGVINMHTIKPLDTEILDKVFETSKLIVTVEEHSIIGGLGGAIAEYKAIKKDFPPQLIIGISDIFPVAGDYSYVLETNGLTEFKIAEKIMARFEG